MQQEMTAGAQAIADAINASGKLDLYGINFATGSAAISPESDKVLTDILAVLSANADWQLRVEGHTDNVGHAAANLNSHKPAPPRWSPGSPDRALRPAA
ncbi:MAG TPA: OmpA family protein [Vicinamibacterales bacterium]|nr:OmpA family protein [Vicinamibacterales bacterium]